jgi:hypothetical protein
LISKTADLLQHPLRTLQPASIWQHFWALTQIPRPSGNEGKIRQHVEAWADDHHFKTITDKKGNLLVEVPPTLGKDSEKASGRSRRCCNYVWYRFQVNLIISPDDIIKEYGR